MITPLGFDVKYIFLAYVQPYYDLQPEVIKTLVLKKENNTTNYLFKIFDSSQQVANIEINFKANEKQENVIRSLILSLAQKTELHQKNVMARKLAQHLYEVTDERNGTGLYAIIQGEKARTTRMVLIRFKGDEGLYNHGKKLLVNYISEVFTKKSNHYKLTYYEDILSVISFWRGYATDKQISGFSQKPISLFWIERFLQSQTSLTAAQGTMQFSKILKSILKKTDDVDEQQQIISGVVNLRNKGATQISIADFCKTYLSEPLTKRIKEETASEDFFNSVFVVDPGVYSKEFGNTVLSMQDGIMAYVPTFSYSKHVTESENDDGSKQVTISARLNRKQINVQKKERVKNAK